MADLIITGADVKIKGKTVTVIIVQVGEIIGRSQPLFRKSTDSKYWLADNNAVESEDAEAAIISLTSAAADGYIMAVQAGPMDVGATLVQSETYVVSPNAGKIMPIGDLASGNRLSYLGYAIDSSTLQVGPSYTGVVK